MSALKMTAGERPRERLIARGAESLKNEELLAILFGTGRQGCDVLEMSRELLNKYGSLKSLSRAHVAELTGKKSAVDGSVKGIGEAKAVTLLAALELGRRAAVEEERRDDLAARLAFWTQSLSADEREFLVAIYLDGKDRPISDERLSYGGVDGALLDAGYLMRRAVRLDCASLVLLHNHPDGDTEPSGEDMQLTRGVASMLDTLQIGFYGHYIVGGGHFRRIPDDSGGEDVISAAASPNRGNK